MNYPSIRIEGAILSPDILDGLYDDTVGQRPADFGLDSGSKVKDEIARAWADAQDYWRIFQRKLDTLKVDSPATTETRNLWMVPLLGLLGLKWTPLSRQFIIEFKRVLSLLQLTGAVPILLNKLLLLRRRHVDIPSCVLRRNVVKG